MKASLHVLINALSMGEGGGLTVGRELLRHLAEARSAWRFTMAVAQGHPVHERLRDVPLPRNCELFWAPQRTRKHFARPRYERTTLRAWVDAHAADAVLQLNGMVVPGLGPKTLSHFQDPWPYAPHAWSQWRDPWLSVLKRRAHAYALRQARCA